MKPNQIPLIRMFAAAACLLIGSTMVMAKAPDTGSSNEDPHTRLLQAVDPGVDAMVGIPVLKRVSNSVMLTLEAMDRAPLLMGSRPIDQAKSMLDLNASIDDLGSAAVLFYFADDSRDADLVFLIPVTDYESFLSGNFESVAGGGWTHASGAIMHIKRMGAWAVMSESAERVASYDAGDGVRPTLLRWLGQDGVGRLRDGQCFVASGTKRLATWVLPNHRASIGALLEPLADELWTHIDGAALVVDFDPLATVLRDVYRLKEDSPLRAATERATRSRSMPDLPDVAHVVSARADLGSGVARHMLIMVGKWLGVPLVDSAADATRGVQAILFADGDPNPLRALQHWAIVYETGTPREWMNAIDSWGQAMPAGTGPRWAEPAEGVRRFTMPHATLESGSLAVELLRGLLFGGSWQGGFRVRDASVELGLSADRYPLRAIERRRSQNELSLDDNGIIRSMRSWLVDAPDLEFYIHPSEFAKSCRIVFEQMKPVLRGAAPPDVPEFSPGGPPIAFGLRQFDDRVETTTIIPVQVLTPLVDSVVRDAIKGNGER